MRPEPRCALIFCLLSAGCGDARKTEPAPAPPPTTSASAPAPEAPRGPLSIALESRGEIVLSSIEDGVAVVDQARKRLAHARGPAAPSLSDTQLPPGLPEGRGRILRVAGRLPRSLWLSFETLRDDGKVDKNPLFRLDGRRFEALADDWKPAISAWSKNRILAASTSSGKLKIKVIEPSLAAPPDDLPNTELYDASCAKSLVVADMAALRTGEIVAAGTCKPETGAGAGASAKRYVVIRWPAAAADASAPPPAHAGDGDAGAGEAGSGPAGVVDVMPGVSAALAHRALFVRSASDIWVAALDATAKPVASHLFHFDGTTWGAEPLPAGAAVVRAVAVAGDGAVWLVSDQAIWKKAAGSWEAVPPPLEGSWEMIDVRAAGDDVWLAGRVRSGGEAKDVVMRAGPVREVVRWP